MRACMSLRRERRADALEPADDLVDRLRDEVLDVLELDVDVEPGPGLDDAVEVALVEALVLVAVRDDEREVRVAHRRLARRSASGCGTPFTPNCSAARSCVALSAVSHSTMRVTTWPFDAAANSLRMSPSGPTSGRSFSCIGRAPCGRRRARAAPRAPARARCVSRRERVDLAFGEVDADAADASEDHVERRRRSRAAARSRAMTLTPVVWFRDHDEYLRQFTIATLSTRRNAVAVA